MEEKMWSGLKSKFTTPEVAAKAVRPGDWVDYGFGAGFSELMDRALAERREELTDVKICGGLVIRPRIEVVESDPEQRALSYYSWHIEDYERGLQTRGLVEFTPVMLRSLPYLYRDRHIRCDVAFVPVSLPDSRGYCGGHFQLHMADHFEMRADSSFRDKRETSPATWDGSHRVHVSEVSISALPLP